MTSAAIAAVPEFLLGMGLLLALAVGLEWFPLYGGRAAFASRPGGALGSLEGLADVVWHLTLPSLTLVLSSSAGFVLLARGSVGATLGAPYLTSARAKGLSEPRIAVRHALPNALSPLLTFTGLRFGQVLGGAIVVERVYGVPGLGLFAFEATRARDYPVLQAVFLLGSLSVLGVNLVVDLIGLRFEARRG